MAHFAEIDSNNIVQRVVVISNDDLLDDNGQEQESIGIQVCKNIFGPFSKWVQTSYNNNFRKKYAGIGDKYDPIANVFYYPNPPYQSWTLNENFDWQAPVEMPDDGKPYCWDEPTLSWVEIAITKDK